MGNSIHMKPASAAVDASAVQRVVHRLTEVYGSRRQHSLRDPLEELIFTILSQNTSDRNSARAGHALRARYSTWDEVLEAPTNELYETIKSAGLGNIKAPRIQAVLAHVRARRGS
jgi:endonuclease-3